MQSGDSYDALVVGAGPAGSSAAFELAAAGAKVCLIDRHEFPRDKACGDLIGSRGVGYLRNLGVDLRAYPTFDETVMVGLDGARVALPLLPGITYPAGAQVVPRVILDQELHRRARDAGAQFRAARARHALRDGDRICGFDLDDGQRVQADVVIGADGALSRVANAAGLVDHHAVLWGYALRSYVPGSVPSPMIVLWEPARSDGYPGFGWLFPSLDGCVNVGLGIGTLAERTAGRRVTGEFDAFLRWCVDRELLGAEVLETDKSVTGAWLKMGVVGTRPAHGNVLLVGEAAGLTNPLTGEGISQAITSGALAGQLVAELGVGAAGAYVDLLRANYLPYNVIASALQRLIVSRPGVAYRTTRLLTHPRVAELVGGAWSMFWNDLSRGARPSPDRLLARVAERTGSVLTARTTDRSWFKANGLVTGR